MDIFDYIKNITLKHEPLDFSNDEIEKGYNPYMISKWLSMCEVYIPIVECLNQTKNLPKKMHYQFLYNVIPKAFVKLNYIKKKKNDLEVDKRELLMKHFEFGERDLECLLSIYNEEQIQNVLDMYKSGKVR